MLIGGNVCGLVGGIFIVGFGVNYLCIGLVFDLFEYWVVVVIVKVFYDVSYCGEVFGCGENVIVCV